MTIPRVFFVGTAGSGKSTMVNSFKDWLVGLNYDAITVNLDPGAEFLPYEPDVDVRESISLEDVMAQYNLGPNGAQIVAADLLVNEVGEIIERIESFDSDYVLIDTPGQLELFAFRQSSSMLVESFGIDSSAIVYLLDSALLKDPQSYASLRFLGLSILTKFYMPFLPVASKSDLLEPKEIENIKRWDRNKAEFIEDLRRLAATVNVQLSEEIISATESLNLLGNSIFASSQTGDGMEDIYAFLQNVFYGSEDLEKR
ncbi:MAG: ATP/GTP-binding protein [Thermoplasmatales archaeon]